MIALERAIAIAAEAHAGQVDKSGAPYILHPLRVMLAQETDEARIVAVLHDVVEDCPDWPLARLEEKEGVPFVPIGRALQTITRGEGEAYKEYIERVGRSRLARTVKIADLLDNLDPRRQTSLHHRQIARYQAALEYLRALGRVEANLAAVE